MGRRTICRVPDARWYLGLQLAVGLLLFYREQHFLGSVPTHATPVSMLLRWNGAAFVPLQEFSARGGRAFKLFRAEGDTYLAYANLQGESLLYRWQNERFHVHQTLSGPGAREFAVLQTGGGLYVFQANFIHGTPAAPKVDLTSYVFKWTNRKLEKIQEFPTSGATDVTAFKVDGQHYVAVSNSLSRDIRFREDSIVYRFRG